MRVLTLDTSGAPISAAVAADGRVDAFFYVRANKTHAEGLMPCVNAILAELGCDTGNFDAFAAVCGPGSFTGLRIGISAIKAFAYANRKKAVGISTLDALAYNIGDRPESYICPVMDARNGNVYQAIYATDNALRAGSKNAPTGGGSRYPENCGLKRLAAPALLSVEQAADRLIKLCGSDGGYKRIVFNGDAAQKYACSFRELLPGVICDTAREPMLLQNAASAALLACGAVSAGLGVPPELLAPEYLNAGYAPVKKNASI